MNIFTRTLQNLHLTIKTASVLLIIVFALIIGASFIVYPSIYAPLIVLAVVLALACLIFWFKKPAWAIYFTLITILLPESLIPAQINSYLNRVLTVVALVVWLADTIRRKNKLIITRSAVFMLFFILWAAITLLWASNFDYGNDILQRYVLRLVLFFILMANEINTNKNLDGFMNTLALSGILLVAVSGFTILTRGYSAGTRLAVLNVNENGLGVSLLISLQGVLWWAFRPSRKYSLLKKTMAMGFFFASIGLIGLSGSRGSAISLVAMLCVLLIWKPTRRFGLIGFLVIGIGLLVAPVVFSTTIARFLGTTGESALGGRETLWVAGWNLIKDHLVLGVGIANSQWEIMPYLASVGGLDLSLLRTTSTPLHNPIMAVWADTGLVGLLLYLGALLSSFISFIKTYTRVRISGDRNLLIYYAIVSSVFIGYMLSWIKGGGMESDFSYFLMLALLWIPFTIYENSPKSMTSRG